MDVKLEELFKSVSEKQWRKFLSSDTKKQRAWLRKHLLVCATDLFSALVLNKVQWRSITLKVVKAIVGNRLSEALAKFLDIPEMVDSKAVKMLEKLVVKEVIKRIQPSTDTVNVKKGSFVKRSIHRLFYRIDQIDQQRPKISGLIKPIIKVTGKHGVFKKYRGGSSWFKKGIPELPTIVEVSQKEEMLAELSYFGYTIQGDTKEFAKMLTDSGKAHYYERSLLSNEFDFQEQLSHGGDQIFESSCEHNSFNSENDQACGQSQFTTAEKKSTQDLSSENQPSKAYVSQIIGLVLCQALESSDKICHSDVFQDIFKWTLEKVWDQVQGKEIQFRSRVRKKYIKRIFLRLCNAIFCTDKDALCLLVMKIPEFEETIVSCFEKYLLKRVSKVERCHDFLSDLYRKIKCWSRADLVESSNMESIVIDGEDFQINFLQGKSKAAITRSSTDIPEITACSRATGRSEKHPEETPGAENEIKMALQTLVKVLEIWNDVQDKDVKLSLGRIEELSQAIFRDIFEKSAGQSMNLGELDKPLTSFFRSCVIEDLKRPVETST
ncbi:uncharacterized protein LOC122829382 isoform X2 [Gambusia affinis]|uniref:uncharacterized protein LOC122829382 isoform X2 n=1 Tax=Gambusia affinis TaxID=33528 RepID=UPI001CDC9EB8|nr:uncharacterized protein LOC122829382 isoform X2 [Gambusia affinis]